MASCPRIPPDFDDWVADAVVALREQERVPEEPLLRAALIGIHALDAVTMQMTAAFAALRDAVATGESSRLPHSGIDVELIASLDPAVAALAGT